MTSKYDSSLSDSGGGGRAGELLARLGFDGLIGRTLSFSSSASEDVAGFFPEVRLCLVPELDDDFVQSSTSSM